MTPFSRNHLRRAMAILAIVFVALAGLTGCETGMKQGVGTVLGAGIGALAGSQIGDGRGQLIATAVGTLAGAFIGSEIGKSLDKADIAYMNQSQQQAFETAPSGAAVSWQNPDSGNSGTVMPQPAFQTADGTYCREFQQQISVGGQTETAYGTACRQPDGQWKIVS